MPPARKLLGHKKSRKGCLRCKARRVKCDERRPCAACVRHHVECSLMLQTEEGLERQPLAPEPEPESESESGPEAHTVSPLPSRLLPVSPTSQQYGSPAGMSMSCEIPSPSDSAGASTVQTTLVPPSHAPSPLGRSPQVASGFSLLQDPSQHVDCRSPEWLQSIRLFHHYTSTAWRTLTRNAATEELWREALPRAAVHRDFLMHGLLAMSALHYAHVHPEESDEYHIVSANYQALAVQNFRSRLNDLNDDNFEAYFFLASLIFTLSLCSIARPQNSTAVNPEAVRQSFILLHGVKSILNFKPVHEWATPLSLLPILYPGATNPSLDPSLSGVPSIFQARLDQICTLARTLPRSLSAINEQTACLLAVESLKGTHADLKAFARTHGPVGVVGIWSWPMTLSQMFLDMLGEGHPVALIILGHFAAISRASEHQDWGSSGWSLSVITMIDRILHAHHPGLVPWNAWAKQSVEQKIDVDEMGSL